MKRYPRLVRITGFCISLAVGSVIAGPATAAIDDSLIDAIAVDLGSGLDQARLSSVPSNGAYPGLTIKIVAFKPIGEAAEQIAAEVEAATIRLTAAAICSAASPIGLKATILMVRPG